MFRNRSLQIKMVKDTETTEPTLVDEINNMTPEELAQYSDDLMKKLIIRIGAVIVVKVAVTIALNAAFKHLESK